VEKLTILVPHRLRLPLPSVHPRGKHLVASKMLEVWQKWAANEDKMVKIMSWWLTEQGARIAGVERRLDMR